MQPATGTADEWQRIADEIRQGHANAQDAQEKQWSDYVAGRLDAFACVLKLLPTPPATPSTTSEDK